MTLKTLQIRSKEKDKNWRVFTLFFFISLFSFFFREREKNVVKTVACAFILY